MGVLNRIYVTCRIVVVLETRVGFLCFGVGGEGWFSSVC